VLGFVHPERMLTKAGACPGDILILSKPLGFGVITTALKRGDVDPEDAVEVISWMKRLNKTASELAVEFDLKGGTDVTGFSLMGHGLEMADASKVGFKLSFEKMPFTRGAKQYAEQWIFPGGSADNRLYYGEHVRFDPSIDEASQMLLFDAQTSGGLLLAVPKEKLRPLLQKAAQVDQMLWEIGEVVQGAGIEVVK